MTDDSRIIASTFFEMRQFFRDVALLLSTGEELFLRSGWESAQADRGCLGAGSYSLDNPDEWLKPRFFRSYRHSAVPAIMAFLAVAVEVPTTRDSDNGMTVVTAGALRFEENVAPGKPLTGPQTSLFAWHLYRHDRADTGDASWHRKPFRWIEGRLPRQWERSTAKVIEAATLGVPLHLVTSASNLEERVVAQLHGLLGLAKGCAS